MLKRELGTASKSVGVMPQRTDTYDLARLGLTSGEGRRLDLYVHVDPFDYGGSRYAVPEELVPVRLDISRTTGDGWAMRLRFAAALDGPCMRCLETRDAEFDVDSYEVHQPGAGDEDLRRPTWASTASTSRPGRATRSRSRCRPRSSAARTARACARGAARTSTRSPDHVHEAEPDPRWAKLSELKFD